RTIKSLWYAQVSHKTAEISLNSTRDPEAHKKRKVLWERALGFRGFSKDFHMVENETEHPAIKGVHESMMAIGVLGTVPWVLSMAGKIPGAAGGYARFTRWCHEQLQEKR
ncbi:unnamed protein product, partial [Fusarium langsethiae]